MDPKATTCGKVFFVVINISTDQAQKEMFTEKENKHRKKLPRI